MGTKIAELYAEISADTSKLDASLKGTQGTLENTGKSVDVLRGTFTEFNSMLMVDRQAMQTVDQAYDATIGTAISLADEVRNLSREIGSSAEESSRLIHAADEMGVSEGTLEVALKNASAKGLRPTIEGLQGMADAYLAIQDPIARTKYLVDTFGRGGLEMGKLLDQGSEGIAKLGAEADRLGLTLSQKDVVAAREFTLATNELKDAAMGLGVSIGKGLIPPLTDFLTRAAGLRNALDNGSAGFLKIQAAGALAMLGFGNWANQIIANANALDQTSYAADHATDEIEKIRAGILSLPPTTVLSILTVHTDRYTATGLTPEEAALQHAAEQAAARRQQTAGQTALGGGRQFGGPLSGINEVGEQGTEGIINGVVIPHPEWERMKRLGVVAQKHHYADQGGGNIYTTPEEKMMDLYGTGAHVPAGFVPPEVPNENAAHGFFGGGAGASGASATAARAAAASAQVMASASAAQTAAALESARGQKELIQEVKKLRQQIVIAVRDAVLTGGGIRSV